MALVENIKVDASNVTIRDISLLDVIPESPLDFGAQPGNPAFDSGPALNAFTEFVRTKYRSTYSPSSKDDPNMYDLAGKCIDLSQGTYYIKGPVVFPDMFNYTLINPSITATAGFPSDRALLEFKLEVGTRPLNGIRINNPVLDANWLAEGCILAQDFWKMPIIGGVLSRYRAYGVKTDYVQYPPHELNMAFTHIGQQPVWEADKPSDVTSGTALDINNYDNNFTSLIISQQYGDIAILRKGANAFSNCHFYPNQETDTEKGRVVILSNGDQFSNCYFDGCSVVSYQDGARYTISDSVWLMPRHGIAINLISNPYQVKVHNCRFRNTTGTALPQSVIRMKTIAEGRTSRPDIQGNYTENCTAISTVGRQYYTLTSTESARVVTITVPDQYQPLASVQVQENASNSNDDTWLVKARMISTSQVRMRPYNMNVGWGSTATYTGGLVLTYNLTGDL